MADSYVKPAVRKPETGAPAGKRDGGGGGRSETPAAPKTSGAPKTGNRPLRNPLADRNPGPSQAGMTPRPSDEPIE